MPTLLNLNHLNLNVRDLERSRRFYCDILGMTLQWEEESMIFLRCGETDFALIQRDPVEVESIHFGFRLPESGDVDAWADHLRKQNATIEHGPFERDAGRVLFARDPDGYRIEFYWEGPDAGERSSAATTSAVSGVSKSVSGAP